MEKRIVQICSADPYKAGGKSAKGLIFNNRWLIGLGPLLTQREKFNLHLIKKKKKSHWKRWIKHSSFGMPCYEWYLRFKFLVLQICQVEKSNVGKVICASRCGTWLKAEYFSHSNFLVNFFLLVPSVMLSMQKSTAILFPLNLFSPT